MVSRNPPKKRLSPNQPMIRSFLVAPLVRELRASSVPADDLLRRHGLTALQRLSLYERISLAHYVALMEEAASLLKRPYLGQELGGGFGMTDLGPMYGSFVCATSIGAAINQLVRFQSALQTNTLLEVVRGPETCTWRYRIEDPAIWPRRQDAEFALAAFATFVRELTGSLWRPLAVEFEHPIAGRERALQAFHNAPVYGNCAYNALVLANADVDRPLCYRTNGARHDVAQIVEQHMRDLLGGEESADPSIEVRARQLIAGRLGRTKVTIESIAAEMSMSVRSLRRHLTEAGTSYRDILQEHRQKAMEAILNVDGERLSNVASRLNYSDASALSRAFKYWTGVSPREYAKKSKSDRVRRNASRRAPPRG
jgi:AraC-like DNA-binding protein